jgi:hypothetical protein
MMGGARFWHGSVPQSFEKCLRQVRMQRNRGKSWHIDRHSGKQSVTIARSVFGSNLRSEEVAP